MSSLAEMLQPVVVAALLWCVVPPRVEGLAVDSYTAGRELLQISVDAVTGDVYVGGANTLLRLSRDLTLLQEMSLGPVPDSADCDPRAPCPQGTPTDNVVRVLEVDPKTRVLLVCGTVRQGICAFHSLSNISSTFRSLSDTFSSSTRFSSRLASNFAGGRKSVAVLLAASPASARESLLFVGQEYDGRKAAFSPSVMSTRKLSTGRGWSRRVDYWRYDARAHAISALDVEAKLKPDYRMEFVEILQDDAYVYFITVQQRSVQDPLTPYPRIGRICFGNGSYDALYRSYVEMALVCQVNGADFPKVLAAVIQDDVLYFSAARTHGGSGRTFDTDPDHGSALCAVPVSVLGNFFSEVNDECYQDQHASTPVQQTSWKVGVDTSRCINPRGFSMPAQFCGDAANDHVQGFSMPVQFCGDAANWGVQSTPSAALNDRLSRQIEAVEVFNGEVVTSLGGTQQNGETVLVMGTDSGRVKKMHVQTYTLNGTRRWKSKLYADYSLSSRPIRKHSAFDATGNNIYFLAGNSVYRFPTGSCALHADCGRCLESKDPLGCGWCGDACTSRQDCAAPQAWTAPGLNASCPPRVESISPEAGPVAGGTLLTVRGADLGSSLQPDALPTVTVGWNSCPIQGSVNQTRLVCRVAATWGASEGVVSVKVSDVTRTDDRPYSVVGTGTSARPFTFAVPTLHGFAPRRGPRSGGTNLTLEGTDLHIGSNLSVTLGQRTPCTVISRCPSEIICSTPQALSEGDVGLRVAIDNHQMVAPHMYTFLRNPEITEVSKRSSIVSGGVNITMRGFSLDAGVQPLLGAMYNGEDTGIFEVCHASHNGSQLTCPSLDLKSVLPLPMRHPPEVVEMYVTLHGVTLELHAFKYYPDPKFHPSPGLTYLQKSSETNLVFKGENLQYGDITVTLGGKLCYQTRRTEVLLACRPSRWTEFGEDKLAVLIRVGNLQFDSSVVGFVKIYTSIVSHVILGAFGALSVIVALLAWLRHVMEKRRKRREGDTGQKQSVTLTCVVESNDERTPGNAYKGSPQLQGAEAVSLVGREVQDLTGKERPLTDSTCLTSEDEIGKADVDSPEAQEAPSHPHGAEALSWISRGVQDLFEVERILIDNSCLTLGGEIGKGNFGCVRKGVLTLPKQKKDTVVAVKTLHNNNPRPLELQGFLEEALLMKDFRHPNVLSLMGICLDLDVMPLIVLPYMEHGDVRSYIRDDNNLPTRRNLIKFGVDIARGMEYIADKKFVHRDLAARNCMLDADFRVRVADFGLARVVIEKEYYRSQDRSVKLPIKWMALESLEKGTYSTKTDVWSYGVVLWELLTRGSLPYPGVNTGDMCRDLKAGRRPEKPDNCPDKLYSLMARCWLKDAACRPTFAELEAGLVGLLSPGEHRAATDSHYVNISARSDHRHSGVAMSESEDAGSHYVNVSACSEASPASKSADSESGYMVPVMR